MIKCVFFAILGLLKKIGFFVAFEKNRFFRVKIAKKY